MAEKTKTFVIRGADGKKAGEQTLQEAFAPILGQGQTAELAEKPKPPAKPDAA
ncbi:hypothetical protein HMPREF9946_02160 [Acetobacteraceae bacterium AT-5844]|nr:hypothetical protein HMPREF9946_02160 [Acetobacteraceae bacterium AT-5844]